MKKILYIAPHSYPIRSSESICNSKVAYTLAKAGHQVDVFACDFGATYPIDMEVDSALRKSENLKIFKVSPRHSISYHIIGIWKALQNLPYNLSILFRTGYFYSGINISQEIIDAIEAQIKLYGKMPYDVLITRGFHTDYVGIYMAKKYGIKWIANWNDPYPNAKFPKPYGSGPDTPLPYFENKLYEDMQKYISIYTYPNPRLRDYMLRCFKLSKKEQSVVIPHMAHSELSPKVKKNDGVLRMLHCGDVRKPRNPLKFLKALSDVIHSTQVKIECNFVGAYDKETECFVNADSKLSQVVHFLGPKSYTDSVNLLAQSTISLIIEAECEEGIYLPTKFVDAIQSCTPVFCVSPYSGMLHDLVGQYKVGYCADNTSIEDIERQLKTLVNDYAGGILPAIDKASIPIVFEDEILNQYNAIL